MADDRTITLYKEGREQKVTPAWFKANKDNTKMLNGWSTAKNSNPPTPNGAGHELTAAPTPKPDGAVKRFGTGFAEGINPLHSGPEGMKSSGNKALDVGQDMLNLREIGAKGGAGDKAGGMGMMAGTIAGLAGPELVKGGLKTIKGLSAVASVAKAGERASELQKELKGSIKTARVAADYTQPIVEAVSKQFDRLHAILDKNTLPHDPKIVQMGKQLEAAAEPAIRKLGQDIAQKTRALSGGAQVLMEYGQAHGLHKQVVRMLSRLDAYKIGQWEPTLRELDGMIETGKETVAKAAGLDKEWNKLGQLWSQANDLSKAIATRMDGPASGMVGKALEKVGFREGLPSGAEKAGKELAKKAGVSARSLPKPHGATQALATGAQAAGPMGRGIMSLMGQGGDGSTPAPVPQ